MHMLFSSTIPIVEFASLSLFLTDSVTPGQYIMAASPLSTTPHASAVLHEMHEYLSQAREDCTNEQKDRERKPELFRSEHCGIALYYLIVRDNAIVRQSFSVLMDGPRGKCNLSLVNGVVITVGISGLSWTQPCSSLITSITTRLQDLADIMSRLSLNSIEECKINYKALLSTLLLTEDEQRRTNAMANAMQVKIELDHRQNEKEQTKFGIKSKRNLNSKHIIPGDNFNENLAAKSSAEIASTLEKRSAVLSVAEKESHLRQYNRKNPAENSMRPRRRKPKADDIFRDFDYVAPTRTKIEVAKFETLSPSSSSKLRKKSTLSRPQRDTAFKKSNRSPSTLSTLPPPPSTLVSNRRNFNQTSAEKRAQNQSKKSKQAAFDAFDLNSDSDLKLNGATIEFPGLGDVKRNGKKSGRVQSIASPMVNPNFNSGGSESSYPFSEDSAKKSIGASFDPFSIETSHSKSLSASLSQSSEEQRVLPRSGTDELEAVSENSIPRKTNGISSSNEYNSRIHVHVALNEDLTCSYKQGRISSCAIEGVVQVQVKSEADSTPFFLLIRDPSRHIRMIQENRRYADDITEHLLENEDLTDHKFTISVPRAEAYFPVMRYKCNPELRPVPIRVQTRVRISQGFCRVALQISSNPANEDDLTDLTIIMGVPLEVRGESVTTHPPGGVWNAAKRSVIWCVAELGEGEKFQLQAQFELDLDNSVTSEVDKPKFPVLVRCQCMYAQLSDIELEVAEIPDVCPAEVTMKLARRFRLMHRERS